MTSIRIDKLKITYGDTTVISELDLMIENGEFFTLLGPSGCGKTTLLRAIAGFITPASGHIAFGEQDVTKIPTYRRNIGMMF
ncbi:putative ABC transporter ATP-binding protein [Microlunatus phosphovorus NM-1]|uniref:Putative ABC transporter ATP-binding protein n=1 Tax=Microlunatus phosphovorus (strain ATCC 700054 / DSM 10555 / JCM 9379 / NBRC 101784 / NCIMB 13414 / VKM Ac-1990 / NM-1) TaxID=1032480 RepID=F5XHV0_MICPN|nr:putative ABC transporter ATP-binding protein [Microlunatus phosphovorus NM-1]